MFLGGIHNLNLFKVTDAIVVMDREQGAVEILASRGIKLHPIISMFKLLSVLLQAERIDAQTEQNVRQFILDNNTFRYNVERTFQEYLWICLL